VAKAFFDTEQLISQFEAATTKGSEQLRQAVANTTRQALQGRELTLKNIRATLDTVAQAAGAGVARVPGVDPQGLLDQAVAGMDDALLGAVEAHRVALSRLVDQGADLREKHLKKALADIDKFEDTLFAAVKKAAEGAQQPLAAPWAGVMEKMQAGGTMAGQRASVTAEKLLQDMHEAMRRTRSASVRAALSLAESYTAMVSGVLIGMSDALQSSSQAKPARKKRGDTGG